MADAAIFAERAGRAPSTRRRLRRTSSLRTACKSGPATRPASANRAAPQPRNPSARAGNRSAAGVGRAHRRLPLERVAPEVPVLDLDRLPLTRSVDPRQPLRDHALEPLLTHYCEQCLPVLEGGRDLPVRPRQLERLEQAAPLDVSQLGCRPPVQLEQIEDDLGEGDPAVTEQEPLRDERKVRPAVLAER